MCDVGEGCEDRGLEGVLWMCGRNKKLLPAGGALSAEALWQECTWWVWTPARSSLGEEGGEAYCKPVVPAPWSLWDWEECVLCDLVSVFCVQKQHVCVCVCVWF